MSRFPRLLLPALCLGVVLIPGLALAGDEPLPPTSQFFDEYDTNADGKVSTEEFRGASEVFKLLDKNGDGVITPEELGLPADYRPAAGKRPAAGREAPAGGKGKANEMAKRLEKFRERLRAMDTNQDGKVSKEEWQGNEKLFERLDRNGDGVLDAQDRPGQGPGTPGQERPRGAGRPAEGGDAPAPEALVERIKAQAAEHFRQLDKDGDGKLSGEEIPNPALLQAADTDKDGSVCLEEMQAALLKRHRARAGAGAPPEGPRPRGPRINAGTLKRWDSDGDGKVSADEFPGGAEAFKHLDSDGDGYLTEADVKALKKARKAAGDEGPKRAPTTEKPNAGLIARMDKDGDGRLNRAEFMGGDEAWKRLDRNQDGWITSDEVGGP